MNNFLAVVLNLLVTSPGNLIYHLVLAFSAAATLQAALARATEPHNRLSARRMAIGLIVLLVAQFVGFIISGLVWQGMVSPEAVLPPLDRVITSLSLLVILWLWAFPDPLRWADALVIFLALVTAIAGAFSLGIWGAQPVGTPFNASPLESAWSLYALALTLIGIIILLIGRPPAWGMGLAMLLAIMLGFLAHTLYPIQGSLAGAVRLAQLAAYPLLLALPQRFNPKEETPPATTPGEPRKPGQERRRYSADPKTVLTLLRLANEEESGAVVFGAARAISQAMLADLCLLVDAPGRSREMCILGGYDLIREEAIEGRMINKDMAPLLANAIQRGKALKLLDSQASSPDLKTLADTLGLTGPCNLLMVPMILPNDQPLGGIVLLSPFSHRAWNNDDQAYLTSSAEAIAQTLQRAQHLADQNERVDQAEAELRDAHRHAAALQSELEALRQQPAGATPGVVDASLVAVQKEAEATIARLQRENDELRAGLFAGGSDEHLRQTMDEMNELHAALADANARLLQTQAAGQSGRLTQSQADTLALMLQELRQPLSSILAQAAALRENQPAGGPADRIATAGERISALLDEMAGALNGKHELETIAADPGLLIDNAIAETGAQMREKSIALRVDLPESLPYVSADPDALQQVIICLLRNAAAVTPAGDAIRLKSRLQEGGSNSDYLLLQVTDSGGGISPRDVPRLFSAAGAPASLEEGEQIAGIGNAYELSMARSLVEAMRGRMLVDAEEGKSTTVSVLMPVAGGEDDALTGLLAGLEPEE